MKLRFTSRATADVEAIADYLNEHSPVAALRVRAAILDSLRRLIPFPDSGRAQAVDGVRKLVTRRYRYVVYYTTDNAADEVIVLTVQHPARERGHDDV